MLIVSDLIQSSIEIKYKVNINVRTYNFTFIQMMKFDFLLYDIDIKIFSSLNWI